MVQDEGSSSVTTSSPLQCFSFMALAPANNGGTIPYPTAAPPPWLRELKSDERGLYLIHLLLNCAAHVTAGDLEHANACLEHISLLSSPAGDTMQRIASCFTEALARRALRPWPGLYRALTPARPHLADNAAVRRLFLDLCPFLKLSYLISNQAILEAMEGERVVHIIDIGGSDVVQWLALLQAIRARPESPPHLRITGVGERKEFLDSTALRLSEEAEKLDIPFQFNSVVCRPENLDVDALRVKTGEAVAINSVFHLHYILSLDDEHRKIPSPNNLNNHTHRLGELLDSRSPDSAASSSKSESLLNSLWAISPKIMVITEQEANHNASSLAERFMEALNYYAALFDCLESTLPRALPERARIEQTLFGEEIKNIIACEGIERRERHEKIERWTQRLETAGFGRVPMSYYGLLQARRLLQSYRSDGYKVKEDIGCFHLCWQDRSLCSISSWTCRRFD